jgi:hypothetical protein
MIEDQAEPDPQDDDLDDVTDEAPPVDEYRMSTR